MNILETLTNGIQFEIKVSQLYKRASGCQKDHDDAPAQEAWKEIVAQKEKEIHLLKKAFQGLQKQGPNASRINLSSSKEIEAGLAWINQTEKEFNTADLAPAKIVKLIHQIVSFELQSIYAPILKVYDLQFIKRDPQLISLLTRHLQSLNGYLKRHRAPSLSPLIKNYPFLAKKEDEKKGFSENELYQNLLNQKKRITLRLKNGTFFSGKLDSFDHFSLKCLPVDPAGSPIHTLFLKGSILSIQIHD